MKALRSAATINSFDCSASKCLSSRSTRPLAQIDKDPWDLERNPQILLLVSLKSL